MLDKGGAHGQKSHFRIYAKAQGPAGILFQISPFDASAPETVVPQVARNRLT